jgi:YhcH/YjgK/YiaL family protein
MILDTITNSSVYANLGPEFAKGFAFLRQFDGSQAMGRHEIDGDRVFALVQSYTTKPIESALYEAHRRYSDIQFIFNGRETILWAPLVTMSDQTMAYDDAKDAALWKCNPTDSTLLRLSAGHVAVFFPQDAHAPGMEWNSPCEVVKVVVKVQVRP